MRPLHAVAPELAPATARLRIGEAARAVGVSPSVLRLWERQELVHPARSRAGYRLYTHDDVAHLRQVRQMRAQQVNAPGIRRILSPRRPTGGRAGAAGPVGPQLRELRRRLGMSLKTAGERASVSASFLSAVERGTADASLATLQRLTHAYGVTMLDLFQPAGRTSRRLRPADRPILEIEGAGVRIEQLALGSPTLEPQLFVLAPGASSDGRYAHDGEEFLFVLAGDVTFWVGERERYRLRAGDALTFPSTLPHRWRNGAGGETQLLWINTPPTF